MGSVPQTMLLAIVVPLFLAIFTLFIPHRRQRAREIVTLIGAVCVFVVSARLFIHGRAEYHGLFMFEWEDSRIGFDLLAYHFNSFILMATSFFGMVVCVYSIRKMADNARIREYYCYLLLTLSAAAGALLADNIVVFLIFWGILAILLYLLISIGTAGSQKAATKALLMVGGSDVLMSLGAGIIFSLAGTVQMSALSLPLDGWSSHLAFGLLAVGALTKAGAMPFHSWIPDCAVSAPVSVMAFLPASVDKLLGIYLLTRICLDFFHLKPISPASIALMSVGGVTIIAAVGMALVQKNLAKLLSFHAVSQVGYMVLGIGTGLPLGILGGLFHMINNSIYKTCLFLCAGSVEHRSNTVEMDRLGGLASVMPMTFLSSLVAALAISGIPPLNGFFSKWLIYQGIIELGKQAGPSWIFPIFLIVAAFGSVLTLASFAKTIHSVFLGGRSRAVLRTREVQASMWIPVATLAALSVIMGLFAGFFVDHFLAPVIGDGPQPLSDSWIPDVAAILMMAGIGVGMLIYVLSGTARARTSPSFIGGERAKYDGEEVFSIHLYPKSGNGDELIGGAFDYEGLKIPSSHFYDSIRAIAFLREIYRAAEGKVFDLYEQIGKPFFLGVDGLKRVHNGVLTTYVGLSLLGGAVIIFVLLLFHFRLA